MDEPRFNDSGAARLLTLQEALTAAGLGWEEVWFEPGLREGDPESKELFEVAFIRGHFVAADGDVGEVRPDTYNRPFHSRLWKGEERPTEEQRSAALWNGDLDDYDEHRYSGLTEEE